MIEFLLPGNPIAKKRPRLGRYRVYDPQEKEKVKCKLVLKSIMNSNGLEMIYNEMIHLEAYFHTQIPKSLSKTKQRDLEYEFNHKAVPGDLDNLLKFFLDCMNGIVYYDDRQIVSLKAEKRYSSNPRTILRIKVLDIKEKTNL